jgi:hypothetical protein
MEPAVPSAGASLGQIRLQLIQDQHDPDHGLWNRLILREHPLKAAPMVGAQLRYLIRNQESIVRAFGVGPAAYYLSRPLWIGTPRPGQVALGGPLAAAGSEPGPGPQQPLGEGPSQERQRCLDL